MAIKKRKIDWLVNPDKTPGETYNIVKGCNGPKGDGIHCSYCYAKQMVKRYDYAEKVARKEAEWIYYCDSPEAVNEQTGLLIDRILEFKPTFFEYVYYQKLRKKPTMYFFSMSDPADWREDWYAKIVAKIKHYPQHTFIILTKRPEIYKRYIFPDNCWLGVTITDNSKENQQKIITMMSLYIVNPKKRFISFEPIQEKINLSNKVAEYFHWVIVGPERGKIVDRGILFPFFNLDVPVFMKESCRPSLYQGEALRQDWPEGYFND